MDGAAVQVAPDGTILYRASALGSCTKALIAARLEYEPLPPPKEVAARFRRGHEVEDEVNKLLRHDGYFLHDLQGEVRLPISEKIAVVGHLDGKRRQTGAWEIRGYDVKSQNRAAWDDFDRNGWESGFFPKYKWQFSAYKLATGLEFDLIRALVNEDDKLVHIEVSEVPNWYTIEEVRARVLEVEAASLSGVLPDYCDHRDFPCPYFYLPSHGEVEGERYVLDDESVDILAREYKDADKDEAAAKGRKVAARSALRTAAGDNKKIVTPRGTKVTFYEIKGRKKLDLAKVAKAGIDLAEYQTVGEATEGMRVTLPDTETKEGVADGS